MGCEGDENLDNDAAADLLGDISDQLFARVAELMQHPRGHEYDNEEIAELFVRTGMIFALHERGMILSAPEQGELGRLVDPFIKRWEEYHHSSGHGTPQKRLESMRLTFRRLGEVLREVHTRDVSLVQLDPGEIASNPQVREDLNIFARWDNPSDVDR
ncbi:hypothetical protein HNR46_003730 [Haloferula luteola]|uniref:Uncharacterized protein n=1 Tax=Haloferula luteola TaxID=595692 RepID=A0A840VI60_9BACT|nr:hypothetical protein [Haloferula luteola]MBB5353469.1 hypothetical protein [Haloferula luteola]